MRQRICDSCGQEKDVKGGRTCENGHFICYDCVNKDVGFLTPFRDLKYFPLCDKPLR
jgi:hypothetical protein